VPVEVIPFGWQSQISFLESLGARVSVRQTSDERRFVTDQGNFIVDCNFGPLPQPTQVARELSQRIGIVEHGLFLGLTTDVIVAGKNGVRHLTRKA